METFYYNLPNIYRKLSLFCLTRLVCENIFSGLKVTKYEIQKPSTFRTCFVASFGFSRFPSCVINLSHMAFLSQHMFSTWPLFLWPFCWVLWLWLPSKPDNNFEHTLTSLLACFALTALMVGLVVQPLHIARLFSSSKGKIPSNVRVIEVAFKFSAIFMLICNSFPFTFHERCFTHAKVVTKAHNRPSPHSKTQQLAVILDWVCLKKTRAAKSDDYHPHHVIIFDRLRFQDVFCSHENEKAAFSKTGLKNDFNKLRFDDWLLCPGYYGRLA